MSDEVRSTNYEVRTTTGDEDERSSALPHHIRTSYFVLRTSLVVNGDDFGYSEAINAAIVRCHDKGVLRSTSVLVNRPATRAALALARSRPTLGVGLHVNLTEGVPVLPPREVPSLVDRHGRFRSLLPQLGGLLSGTTDLDEVERELRAQFAILLDAGIRPTHLDGHLHAHAFPGVLDVVVRLMGEFGVRAMRSPLLGAWAKLRGTRRSRSEHVESSKSRTRPSSLHAAASFFMLNSPFVIPLAARVFPDGSRGTLVDSAGIVRAGYLLDAARFVGLADPAQALADTAGAVPGGIVEVMAHPAWNRDAVRGAAETALLTDPRLPELLAARGVRVRHYGDLAGEATEGR